MMCTPIGGGGWSGLRAVAACTSLLPSASASAISCCVHVGVAADSFRFVAHAPSRQLAAGSLPITTICTLSMKVCSALMVADLPDASIARDVCHREEAHFGAGVVRARGDQRGERASAVCLRVVCDEYARLRNCESDGGEHSDSQPEARRQPATFCAVKSGSFTRSRRRDRRRGDALASLLANR